MKRVITESEELANLIKIYRIVVTVEYERTDNIVSTDILPLQNPDGSYNAIALDLYDEFIINALSVFDAHNFVIIEEHSSPHSKSQYFALVKKEDEENYNYKYILHIRISDHALRNDPKKQMSQYCNDLSEKLKQPTAKSKQVWRLKNIVVNKERFDTYEEALDAIDKRLPD